MTDYILTAASDPLITVLSGDTVTLAEGESYLGEVFGITDGSAPVTVQIDGSFSEPELRDSDDNVIYLVTDDPLSQGHSVVIGETGVVNAYGAISVLGGAGGSVTNHGVISNTNLTFSGAGVNGISLGSEGGTVLNTGTIDMRGPSLDYDFPSVGISAFTGQTGGTVINEGAIHARRAVFVQGDSCEFVNTGTVDAVYAILIEGDATSVVNEGTITAHPGELGSSWAVNIVGSGSIVRNTGTMTGGLGTYMTGTDNTVINHGVIDVEYGGIAMELGFGSGTGGTLRLLNTGLVESTVGGTAVYMAGSDVVEFANAGTILGTPQGVADLLAVVEVSADDMTLVNTGHIGVYPGDDGTAVLMVGGDAELRNSGTVRGDVQFGAGTDVYDGTGGVVAGVIRMGLGSDRATGGDLRDVILGGGGHDVLSGGGGADILAGQAGADTLDGGAGDDLLIGGAGPDVFVFGLVSGDDVIADAGAGDRLDLSALGPLTEAEVLAEASDTADGVLIDLTALGGDGSVLLAGLALSDLQGDWVV